MDFSKKKEQWLEAKKGKAQAEIFRVNRERLEQNISTLKSEIYALELRGNPHVESKKELLVASKKKLQELDHLLDRLEEFSEEAIEALKQDLVAHLLAAHPEQELRYRQWEEARLSSEGVLSECQKVTEIFQPLQKAMEEVLTTRQKVRRAGIFSYIFGQNPNVKITQAIQESHRVISEALPQIEKLAARTSGGDLLHERYGEVIVFLSELKTACEERWSFKKLDTVFAKAGIQLHAFVESFCALAQEKERDALELNEAIEQWIEDPRRE